MSVVAWSDVARGDVHSSRGFRRGSRRESRQGSRQGFGEADGGRRIKLAVVGCGPRGLQVLESLARHLSPSQLAQLEVTIFEPATYLGAGEVYDPRQNHCLKMNFATQHIDFWKSSGQRRSSALSLIDWLRFQYPRLAKRDAYIPRAIVGEYLSDCWTRVRKRLERFATVEINHSKVEAVECSAAGWVVHSRETCRRFDQVVLTVGHEGLRSHQSGADEENSDENNDSSAVDLAGAVRDCGEGPRTHGRIECFVFPTQQQLSEARIAPGVKVGIRGMGLTAIDAVLMLTEARGGKFETVDGRLLPVYLPSGREPSAIMLRSRSGRPMLSKPSSQANSIPEQRWEPFREQLRGLASQHGRLNFRRQIWSIVVAAASEVLRHESPAGTHSDARQPDVGDWYRHWVRYKMDAATAMHAMLQSFAVATGRRPIDIPFALGASWRALYAELVPLISFGGLAEGHWKCYQQTACEMERIAFGPPAENIGKLLTLVRQGVVTLNTIDETGAGEVFDVQLNAVLAEPHQPASGGPLKRLLDTGVVHCDPISGGLRVDDTGAAIGAPDGLNVFGRATEGWIVGNDTLSRELHQQIEAWADSMTGVINA